MLSADQQEGQGAMQGERIADIVLPLALDQAYSYRVPPQLGVNPGQIVHVPLGNRETYGLVWSIQEKGGGDNLKPIRAVTALPALSPALMHFLQRVSAYTLAPLGLVAKMAMRDPEAEAHEAPKFGLRLTGTEPRRLTPTRARVLAAAQGLLVHRKRDLAEAAACSTGVIDALVDEGVFEVVPLPSSARAAPLLAQGAEMPLNPQQEAAAVALRSMVISGGFQVSLLEGVTGSGKTEVYFEAVAAALASDKQALILLPEISLTAEFVARFETRFGGAPGLWHSGIAPTRRDRLWHAVAEGEARVVVGARSALFLPFSRLGLLVVDEEHEAAFKQDDLVRYHARDMAVLRGQCEGCPVILASATPSIESRVNAAQGRYQHLQLNRRATSQSLPELGVIDLTKDPPIRGSFLSPRLLEAIGQTLERGEQALIFLNRRGYAPLTLCRACGHRWQCPQCDAWLVEHRFRRALVCHHCEHTERRPQLCSVCGAEDSLVSCGPGVERVAEEIAQHFPDQRRIVLSSDFPGGTERLKRELQTVAEGEFPLVIGTQLIAKGHNFPHLTLAALVDADLGLVSNDPRAAERSFQLLSQVTGRAGRGTRPGRGLLQTYQPQHPVIRALLSGDHERFYAAETAAREVAGLPPFGRLAALLVSARDKAAAEHHARLLVQAGHRLSAEMSGGAVTVLGPAEPPLALLRGKHRIRLILKAPRMFHLQGLIRGMIASAGSPKGGARVDVDIDPLNFL